MKGGQRDGRRGDVGGTCKEKVKEEVLVAGVGATKDKALKTVVRRKSI